MTDKCETCRDCRATIPLPPPKVSNLYAILCGCYGSPNVKKSDVWTMHVFPNPVTIMWLQTCKCKKLWLSTK